jgi:hypothetical protein
MTVAKQLFEEALALRGAIMELRIHYFWRVDSHAASDEELSRLFQRLAHLHEQFLARRRLLAWLGVRVAPLTGDRVAQQLVNSSLLSPHAIQEIPEVMEISAN